MFCPFRSTADKKVECSEDCALYVNESEPCSFFSLAITLDTTNKKLEYIASEIHNQN